MLFAVILSHSIAERHFPFLLKFKTVDFVKLTRKKNTFFDLAKHPEFILLLITIVLLATVGLISAFLPKGV